MTPFAEIFHRSTGGLFIGLSAIMIVMFATGCDVAGTVFDFSNNSIQVTNLHLSGTGRLKVISGSTINEIPLEAFESLTLFPDETSMAEGSLCFGAELILRDGTRIAARDKDNENAPLTFVAVDQTLLGSSHRGEFRASLTCISKIVFK